jgi:hypothetical protein
MITTIFKKSNPINYAFVGILMFLFFFIGQFYMNFTVLSINNTFLKTVNLFLLLISILAISIIAKKNGLSKDSAYALFFGFLFIVFFPNLFADFKLITANLFIVLAMRRLIMLQTLKFPKEKIFDASLLIFIATLFHFWSILFLLLVFITIIMHAGRDYRNWVIPFIAFFAIIISFVFYSLAVDRTIINDFLSRISVQFSVSYFKSIYENISFSLFATISLFFITTLFMSLPNKPLVLNSSFKKLIIWFLIAVIVFIISPNKSNASLVFTFAPLAIIANNFIESINIKWQQELTLALVIASCFFGFFSQL